MNRKFVRVDGGLTSVCGSHDIRVYSLALNVGFVVLGTRAAVQ